MQLLMSYQINQKVYLDSSSRTTAGVWISNGSPIVCDQNVTEDLGRQILHAAAESFEGVAHPKKWQGIFEPMLRIAGFKSYRAFTQAARAVEIEFDDAWTFTPLANLGPGKGFEPGMSKAIRLSTSEPTVLAKSLLSAFDQAE